MWRVWALFFVFWCVFSGSVRAGEEGFTQEDRERLIRLEATLKVFMEQTNRRFEELRADMNARFKQIDKRFEQVDKRFEQVDKRFEQVSKQFEQLYTFLWIITGIFTTLTAVVIGFALWDRRSTIRRAREEAVEEVERVYGVSRLRELLRALRELAKEDARLAEVLRSFGLL